MKKILLLLAGLSVMFAADIRIYLCGGGEHAAVSDDGSSAEFDVCMDSAVDIAGIQVSMDAGNDFSTTTAVGGTATNAAGWLTYAGGGNILSFSMGGTVVPAGSELHIFTVTGSYSQTGATTMALSLGTSGAISDSNANSINSLEFTTSSWDAGSGLLDAGTTPAEYSLKAAYPNPFNPTTTIEYNVLEPSDVSIVVYDMMGREVKTLVNDFVSPSASGSYSVMWDGTNNANAFVATGIYVYRMIANDFVKTQKMTLAK